MTSCYGIQGENLSQAETVDGPSSVEPVRRGRPRSTYRKIPLYNIKTMFAIVDEEDYELVSRFKWCLMRGSNSEYAVTFINGKTVGMHGMIMGRVDGLVLDHINHEGLDNRKSNLRHCTHQQNQFNKVLHKDNRSGYKGVSKRNNANRWAAQICVNYKVRHIGLYKTPEEAARAYDAVAKEVHGEFAKLNFQYE